VRAIVSYFPSSFETFSLARGNPFHTYPFYCIHLLLARSKITSRLNPRPSSNIHPSSDPRFSLLLFRYLPFTHHGTLRSSRNSSLAITSDGMHISFVTTLLAHHNITLYVLFDRDGILRSPQYYSVLLFAHHDIPSSPQHRRSPTDTGRPLTSQTLPLLTNYR
jgi:hypothetical protein